MHQLSLTEYIVVASLIQSEVRPEPGRTQPNNIYRVLCKNYIIWIADPYARYMGKRKKLSAHEAENQVDMRQT